MATSDGVFRNSIRISADFRIANHENNDLKNVRNLGCRFGCIGSVDFLRLHHRAAHTNGESDSKTADSSGHWNDR